MATDADWVRRRHRAALDERRTTFTVCRDGRAVSATPSPTRTPDLAILDLQIGSMGGMAVTMALRLDESAGPLARRAGPDAARPGGRRPPGPAQRRRRLADQAARRPAPRAERSPMIAAGGRVHRRASPMRAGRADPEPTGDDAESPAGETVDDRIECSAAPGCSAAWLARHVRDVEAGSSNLPTPTEYQERVACRGGPFSLLRCRSRRRGHRR